MWTICPYILSKQCHFLPDSLANPHLAIVAIGGLGPCSNRFAQWLIKLLLKQHTVLYDRKRLLFDFGQTTQDKISEYILSHPAVGREQGQVFCTPGHYV